jgi:Ca2+-binding RTX toxin-like protein
MRALAVTSLVALATAAIASAATIIGNDSANVIVGSASADYIEARGGNDQIDARGGADEIRAGTGADRAYGGTGKDEIVGGDGADWLFAGCPNGGCNAGSNVIFGGNGNDVVGADNGKYDNVNCSAGGGDVAYVDSIDDWTGCEIRHIDGNSP